MVANRAIVWLLVSALVLLPTASSGITPQQRQIIFHKTPTAAAAGCSDTNATAWVTAVGTVAAGTRTNVCNLIVQLKADGLWARQSRIFLHALDNTTQATTDIANIGTATPHGSLTFTANQGYTGDGSTAYLDSGFSENGDPNTTLNGASFSSYVLSSQTSGSGGAEFGFFDPASTGAQTLLSAFSSGFITFDVNNAQFTAQSVTTNSQGFYTEVRTSSSGTSVYKNSTLAPFATAVTTSVALTSFNLHILARNDNNSPDVFCACQVAVTVFGGQMTAAETVTFQNDINAFMQAQTAVALY